MYTGFIYEMAKLRQQELIDAARTRPSSRKVRRETSDAWHIPHPWLRGPVVASRTASATQKAS